MHIILPKERPVLTGKFESMPLFFLAGPIQGAGDWQHRMTNMLVNTIGECVIVNPSRYDNTHPTYWRRLQGPVIDERQTDWERYYLRQAASGAHRGCLIFWLPKQVCAREDGKDYATDSLGEIGEWRGHMMHEPNLRVVIGAEKGFPPLDVMARNFEQALGPDFPIYDSMGATVVAAVAYARQEHSLGERMPA